MNRLLYPILGILIVIATVAQVSATRAPRTPKPRSAALAKEPARIVAEGRVVAYPGAEVVVGSDVAGTIATLNVDEKDHVHAGDVLAIVKADDTRAALAESRARVVEADADIRLFQADAERARSLWQQDVGAKQAVDKAERDVEAARARRASATAEVRRLEALVGKTVITAPIDGVVIARHVHPGETIAEGANIVTIADLRRTRVEAEVDEFDAARVRGGANATILAEGYDRNWRGAIEEIPDSVVNRRIKPQDPSKPIDTRVLLVKIAFAEPTPLKLGQRVEVRIDGQ
ncbi:MAG: efflux RND transporter periplasmic adaptor subunit [Acidobacteria bacterium]|nr:efflux RND transporter periplasmic adaptor subunit [Acidobacteriota bacterium]MBV9475227.1 efflux RND transporter periplasmic adaptor subunit [Acidobacteriota bacterium]